MQLAKVIGNVVCSVKNPVLEGKKLLVIQPLDRLERPVGKPLVALDSVGAGAGETVYWCRGREASFVWYPTEVPTECTIVGIVDRVHVAAKGTTDSHR
jgi:ethanolamine utilization protein EutN